jgi:hypothetical protein
MTNIISKAVALVGWLLLISALGFYAYGIYSAIIQTLSSSDTQPIIYPEFLSTTIGSIQALLLTNLGMLLGISVTSPTSNVAKFLKLTKQSQGVVSSPMELKEQVQLFALVIYILSLVACLITWISIDFNTDSKIVVSVITESSKMFIGVVLAYLTVVLSK